MKLSGFGIGLRTEFIEELPRTARAIDWLEIIPENFVDLPPKNRKKLHRCAERWPIVPHSISMSIGGPTALDPALFRVVTELCHDVGAPFWSDHLSFTTIGGWHSNDLLPLPFSDEALGHVLGRIARATSMTDVPLVFENPTYYANMPGATMPEEMFLRRVFEESRCGFLLDVNNVYVNAKNHGFDPEAFVRALPLESVRQIHLAGHTVRDEVIIDTHKGPICDEVWSLYRYTLGAIGHLVPTLVEWDLDVPALDVVVDELDRARAEAKRALEYVGKDVA